MTTPSHAALGAVSGRFDGSASEAYTLRRDVLVMRYRFPKGVGQFVRPPTPAEQAFTAPIAAELKMAGEPDTLVVVDEAGVRWRSWPSLRRRAAEQARPGRHAAARGGDGYG